MKIARVGFAAMLLATNLSGQTSPPREPVRRPVAGSCESLASLSLPNVAITSAQDVAAGTFTPPGAAGRGRGGQAAQFSSLPTFCRVTATLTPSSDSDIKVEIWLPAFAPSGATAGRPNSAWNGKLQSVGNGGWAGTISYPALATAVAAGYASASTDTGHATPGASWALDHPEKLVDYAYRAVHEMTVVAKAGIAAYYGRAPRLSYWNGCSMGGRQALKEAQRFPADYDGIIAGAPASNWTGRASQSMRIAHAMLTDEANYIPPAKYPLIHNAVLQACDANDGVKDGVIEDPTRCKFDPNVLECKGEDSATCLTPRQVESARKVYSAAVNPRTGREIFPGLEPGSELGWATWGGPQPFATGVEHFRYVVFKDPNWDFRTLNLERDLARAEDVDNGLINSLDPNLKAFVGRGGKMIHYHGWSDPQISPRSSVRYYESVRKTMGTRVQDSYRLFMVPGMAHCGGGEGPNSFNMLTALEQWVENKKAPDHIIASRLTNGVATRTRPLCPYPQVAQYKGSGSTDDAANFVCRVP
jgi:feruloyl esterase